MLIIHVCVMHSNGTSWSKSATLPLHLQMRETFGHLLGSGGDMECSMEFMCTKTRLFFLADQLGADLRRYRSSPQVDKIKWIQTYLHPMQWTVFGFMMDLWNDILHALISSLYTILQSLYSHHTHQKILYWTINFVTKLPQPCCDVVKSPCIELKHVSNINIGTHHH